MALDFVKNETAGRADGAKTRGSGAEPQNENSISARNQTQPFSITELQLALDTATTHQSPQPVTVVPSSVFEQPSTAAAVVPENAPSPRIDSAVETFFDAEETVGGKKSSVGTSTPRRDTTSVEPPSFAFNIELSSSSQDVCGSNSESPDLTDAAGSSSGSSAPIVYQFGSFQGFHNVTPVPSPKFEPFRASNDFDFNFSLPSPQSLSPKAASNIRISPRNSRSSSLTGVLGTSSRAQLGRPSADTGQSSVSEPTLLLRQRSVSDLSNPAAGSGSQQPVVAYSVLEEETPHHPFFSNEFQASLQGGVRIAKEATDRLKSIQSIQESALDGLLTEAEELCSFRGTSTRTIAILGDSGQGKSSLINSLLHSPGLARTGDTGSACTSVVTEYRHKQPNQKDNILIEVEILSRSEIEDVVLDYLQKYRLFHNADYNHLLKAEEFHRSEANALQAWSVLETAFGHHQDFSKRFLRDESPGALELIKSKIVQWANDIDWPDNVQDSVWRSSAKDARECFQMTRKFMGDKFWPFTKIIRIYSNAQILKTGIILADLPGLQDTNVARVAATQDYLMKCNTVFIVANISRAITDQSLKSSLLSVLSRHVPLELEASGRKALRVAVICTRVEDIDIENAKREFCEPPRNSVDLAECDRLESEIEAARQTGNLVQKKILKLQYKLLFIEARNQHVKRGLQSAYASEVPGQRLDVFCVSNTIYETHVRKGNPEFVAASGIPELRRFCHTITADAQLQEARHFLKSSIPSLLTSLEIRISSLCSKDETLARFQQSRNRVYRGLDEMSSQARSAIRQLIEEFNKDYVDQVGGAFVRNELWQDAAAKEGGKWKTWHWTQYNAWCRNDGYHATNKRDPLDWNALIIWKMRTDLAYGWSIVEDEVPVGIAKLQKTLEGLFTSLQALLAEVLSGSDLSMLDSALSAQMHNVTYRVQRAMEEYSRAVSLTRRYASETNQMSFILRQMAASYLRAAEQKGTGKAERQIAIVQGRITDGELFPTICALMSDSIHHALQKTQRELLEMMQAVTGHIRSDFVCVLGDEDSDSDERQPAVTVESTAALKTLREALTNVKRLSSEAKMLFEPIG